MTGSEPSSPTPQDGAATGVASASSGRGGRSGSSAGATTTPDLTRLRRWQDAGGTWQVLRRTAAQVTVSLCRCDGGEEADRFTSADPQLLAYLVDKDTSEAT